MDRLHFQTMKIPIERTQSEIVPSKKRLKRGHANSDLDWGTQICSFRERRSWKSGYLNTNSTFATFGQPGSNYNVEKNLRDK